MSATERSASKHRQERVMHVELQENSPICNRHVLVVPHVAHGSALGLPRHIIRHRKRDGRVGLAGVQNQNRHLVLRQRLGPNLDGVVLQRLVQHTWGARPRVIYSDRLFVGDNRPHPIHAVGVAHVKAKDQWTRHHAPQPKVTPFFLETLCVIFAWSVLAEVSYFHLCRQPAQPDRLVHLQEGRVWWHHQIIAY
jgi:hypothetical protein